MIMTFKFNGGYGAVLCDNCRVIVASGKKAFELLFVDEPKSIYSLNDINTRLKIMAPTKYFCCEECRDEYTKKQKDRYIIVKKIKQFFVYNIIFGLL